MGRWTPTVRPEAPRLAPMFDIGSVLGEVADGIEGYKDRKTREAREQEEKDRYYARENEEKIARYKAEQRQAKLDEIAAGDRQRRIESDYVTTLGRAKDDGYGDTAAMDARAGPYGAARDGSAMMGGAGATAGMAGATIYDALYDASTGGDELTLTDPAGEKKRLRYDPTQTREARAEQSAIARQRTLDAMKPAPRDVVSDELREYEGKIKLDRQYRINDFKPEKPSGGGSGGSARDQRLRDANTMFDNANQVVARIERQEPKRPTFDRFNGMDRPVEGEPTYPAFKADSLKKEGEYDQKYAGWQSRLGAATKQAQKWNDIGDAIASEVVGARGGDSVFTQQQINAQREIGEATKRLQNTIAATAGDPEAEKEARQRYFEDVRGINLKYGIRPKPED